MTTVTDDFNRANETPISTNWSTATAFNAGLNLTSNQLVSAGTGNDCSYWDANSFGNDQYSSFTAVNVDDGGPAIRIATGAETCYLVSNLAAGGFLYRALSGSYTSLGDSFTTWNTSDTIQLEATSDTLIIRQNGSDVTGGGITDSNIASGEIGAFIYDNQQLDDFDGGDLVTAPVPQRLMIASYG